MQSLLNYTERCFYHLIFIKIWRKVIKEKCSYTKFFCIYYTTTWWLESVAELHENAQGFPLFGNSVHTFRPQTYSSWQKTLMISKQIVYALIWYSNKIFQAQWTAFKCVTMHTVRLASRLQKSFPVKSPVRCAYHDDPNYREPTSDSKGSAKAQKAQTWYRCCRVGQRISDFSPWSFGQMTFR